MEDSGAFNPGLLLSKADEHITKEKDVEKLKYKIGWAIIIFQEFENKKRPKKKERKKKKNQHSKFYLRRLNGTQCNGEGIARTKKTSLGTINIQKDTCVWLFELGLLQLLVV